MVQTSFLSHALFLVRSPTGPHSLVHGPEGENGLGLGDWGTLPESRVSNKVALFPCD